MSCPANELLHEGTRGPGKTDGQLMKFRRYVGLGYGRHWRGVIFDREYKNLDDLVSKSMRWFPEFGDGARFLASKSDYRWVWPTGEELLFRQVKRLSDYWGYHGQEFPFIGWNELTKYPNPDLYDMLMSCNRSSFLPEEHPIYMEGHTGPIFLPPIPLLVHATTNPYGPGHMWVKMRWIDSAPPGVIVKKHIKVFNPRTQKREVVTRTQVRIFGSYKENRYLDPIYIANLEAMTDENKRRAWLYGDWNIVAGGALDDVWFDGLVKPRFKIPRGWRIDRAMDWGSSHPFAIGWWAEADGTEAVMPDGKKWCPPKGTLIKIEEWYGTESLGTNRGLRLSAAKVAIGVKEREAELLKLGWIQTKVQPGPADNQIGEVRDEGQPSIKTRMATRGVVWTDSVKSAGSRKNGLQLLRDRMEASKLNEGPGIYFMQNCKNTIALLPIMPRDEDDPDDVDTQAEDHLYDETRYRVLHAKQTAKVKKLPF